MELEVRERVGEREVIRRVVAGDREAYRLLVEAHQGQVFAMIMRQVGDTQIAHELSQDTFLKAYLNLASFRSEARFSTWITRIAINTANSFFASRRYKEMKLTNSLDTARAEDLPEERDDSPYSDEAIQQLRKCLGEMKSIYREVVVLCCLDGRTYEEAAAILEIPVGTVCSRMNKAFQTLRTNFWQG